MWEPVGPLPAAVYRRRRRVAAAVCGLVVLLVTLLVMLVVGSGGPGTTVRAAHSALTEADPPPSAEGTADTALTTPTDPPATPLVEGGPATTSEELQPDRTPRSSVPVPSPLPVPPTGPVPCTNAMIKVTAEIDAPTHRVGDHPVLRLVITDVGGQPCVRDLDSSRQEIVVWSGDGRTRLWSSNDCGNPGAPDLRTLVPQQPVVSAVTWAGRTSTPGCALPRRTIPAGAYRVMSRLDNIISAPTPFLLT